MNKNTGVTKISTLNLGCLSAGKPIFLDFNKDEYPDHINIALGITPGMDSGPVWAGLLNLACRLNMESCGRGISAPVICTTAQKGMLLVRKPSSRARQAACLEKNSLDGWQLSGHSPHAIKKMLDTLAVEDILLDDTGQIRFESGEDEDVELPFKAHENRETPLDVNPVFDLTCLAEKLLVTSKDNPRGTRLVMEVVLPETLSTICGRALFSLISMASSNATELTLPLAHTDRPLGQGLCLVIEENKVPEASIRYSEGTLKAQGRTRELAVLIREMTRLWFETGPGGEALKAWLDGLKGAARMAAGLGEPGRIAHILAKEEALPPVDREYWHKTAAACRLLGVAEPDKKEIIGSIKRQMTLPGEEEGILKQAAGIPDGNGPAYCRVFLGRGKRERRSLGKRLEKLLKFKGYEPEICVLRSHKPGVSWLLEEVEPCLTSDVRRLEICVRPFYRPRQMESKSRWIQEMYPAPDIICRRRGWQMDQVQMAVDDAQSHDYTLRAYDSAGGMVAEHSMTPLISELPFVLEKKSDQIAYPTSAGFELIGDGQILHTPIPTDREVFWRRFQDRWLPELEAIMKEMLPELLASKRLAFWEEIRIEVAIDEEQESLEFEEERISPMEALHEDLYFGLLAFMECFRDRYCPDTNLQLGRIVPMMYSARGKKPWAKLRLKPLQKTLAGRPKAPTIGCIAYTGGLLSVNLSCGSHPLDKAEQARLCVAAEAFGYGLTQYGQGLRYMSRPIRRQQSTAACETVTPPDVHTIPSGDAVREWIQSLTGRPGIKVWTPGHTLMGRDIPVVEATTGDMSPKRARLLKSTLLVNARHHANEVSGTNAAMALLHQLTLGGKAGAVLSRTNIVVVPLENADGVATLEEMLPDASNHKLHAARYNALGLEWYDQYFNPDTPFSEARVKARLFDRWLPEYMIDLHGVPSHEWEQPFAGYTSPRFREYWIPRSFVYAVLPFYRQAGHPGADDAGALARRMSEALSAQPDMVSLNQQIFDRYRRYGKAFEPEVFDSNMEGTLVVVPTCERISKTNFANQKWPLVKNEIITEVLDEVARGPWLERCTRAHLVIIDALLDHMGQAQKAVLVRREGPGGVHFAWQRSDNG